MRGRCVAYHFQIINRSKAKVTRFVRNFGVGMVSFVVDHRSTMSCFLLKMTYTRPLHLAEIHWTSIWHSINFRHPNLSQGHAGDFFLCFQSVCLVRCPWLEFKSVFITDLCTGSGGIDIGAVYITLLNKYVNTRETNLFCMRCHYNLNQYIVSYWFFFPIFIVFHLCAL